MSGYGLMPGLGPPAALIVAAAPGARFPRARIVLSAHVWAELAEPTHDCEAVEQARVILAELAAAGARPAVRVPGLC